MDHSFPAVSIQQMMTFVAVVEAEGFANASKVLNMTQSAVSKSIARLEKELGIKLFERSTRYLKITEAGNMLYIDWKIHLSSLQNSYQQALNLQNSSADILRIGLMNTASPDKYFYPRIKEFEKKFPDIKYEVESQYMTDLVKALENEQFDLILLPDFTRFHLERRDLKWSWFTKDNARLIMSARHPLAKRKRLKTKDLLNLKFVTVSTFHDDEEYYKDLCERLAPYGVVPEVAHIYKTAYDIRYLFRPDDAVLLVDAYFEYSADEKEFVTLPVIDQKNGVICAWNPKKPSAARDRFLELMIEEDKK